MKRCSKHVSAKARKETAPQCSQCWLCPARHPDRAAHFSRWHSPLDSGLQLTEPSLMQNRLGNNSPALGGHGPLPQTTDRYRWKAQPEFWVLGGCSEHSTSQDSSPTKDNHYPAQNVCWSYLRSVKSKYQQVDRGRIQNSKYH